jgi:hypothetical protein
MTDSVLILDPIVDQLLDDNGDPVPGGYIEVYAAGTSTPLTVYSDAGLSTSLGSVVYCDSAGFPVASSGSSTKVAVFAGTADYKLIAKTSAGVTLRTIDNLPGALDTSSFAVTSAAPVFPVVAKASTSWTVDDNAPGTIYDADPTGGTQLVTFPSAVTVGDGYAFTIRHNGASSSNAIGYVTSAGQTIRDGSQASAGGTLRRYGEAKTFVSDGAGWTVRDYAPPLIHSTTGLITIVDLRSAAPASPTYGNRHIIESTPTGTWAGQSVGTICEYLPTGGWKYITPHDGWLAYVTATSTLYQYRSTEWVALSNIAAPEASYTPCVVVRRQFTSGTDGGTATSGPDQDYVVNNFTNSGADNVITGATVNTSTGVISGLPVGWYRIRGSATFAGTNSSYLQWYNVSTTTIVGRGPQLTLTSATVVNGQAALDVVFEVTDAAHEYKIQYRVTTTNATDGLGIANSLGTEVYGNFVIESLERIQGPVGDTGASGAAGRDAGFGRWTFSTTTTESDPGSGVVRADNATAASITEIYISETDADSAAMAGFIATFGEEDLLQFRKASTPGTFLTLRITGAITDNGTWVSVPVEYVAGATPSNADSLLLMVATAGPAGAAGATGATGAAGANGAAGATGATGPNTGLDYAWSTATSGDPGSGKVLANNATLASATAIHISYTGRNSEALSAVIATWDDSTNTSHYGHLRIFTVADRTEYIEAEITGLTDNTTYATLAVTVTAANGTPSANDVMAVMFERTGNKGVDGLGAGDVVGPASATDNSLVRYDGTTGKLLKDGAVIGADVQAYSATLASWSGVTRASGYDTFAATPSSANLAALVTDETGSGALVFATSPTLVTPALGTPSSGTLTNCTGLPVAGGGTGSSTASGARTNLSAAALSQTDRFMSGLIETPADQDYRIALNLPAGVTITSTTTRSSAGTCTATFKINTTALGGTANSVSTTEQTQAHASANVASVGDDIVLTVSSNSSCADLSFLIEYTETLV